MISAILGDTLFLTEQQLKELILCALLHDIGKTEIKLDILNKPSRLNRFEFTYIKDHTIYGYHKLKDEDISLDIKLGVLTHHERYDGSGYPLNLKGDNIPYFGRILAIADVFEALTAKRPYKEKETLQDTINIMLNEKGHFDPNYLRLFIDIIDIEYSQLKSELLYI